MGSCFVDRCLIFCTFSLVIILSVPRFTDSDYPFDIFPYNLVYVVVQLIHSEGKKWVENAVKFQKLMAFKKEISHGIRGKNLNLTTNWKLKSVKG